MRHVNTTTINGQKVFVRDKVEFYYSNKFRHGKIKEIREFDGWTNILIENEIGMRQFNIVNICELTVRSSFVGYIRGIFKRKH